MLLFAVLVQSPGAARSAPAVAPERIALQRLGVERTQPPAVAANPRRGVRGVNGDGASLDGQLLMHGVGEHRHVVAKEL
jgi:hypothetical protein